MIIFLFIILEPLGPEYEQYLYLAHLKFHASFMQPQSKFIYFSN